MNWTTKDGESFPIHMMSDTHLNNAILLMRRNGWITTAEAGDCPHTDEAAAITWASKPASLKLDALAAERLRRIESGASINEPEAVRMREEYAVGQRQQQQHYQRRYGRPGPTWAELYPQNEQARLAGNARATRYRQPPPYFNEPDDDWHHDDIPF